MVLDWQAELLACEERVGPPPREVRDEWRIHLRTTEKIAFALDRLRGVLRDQDEVLRHGRPCWGHLVQANTALFEPSNRKTLPADIVFDPAGADGDVAELVVGATALFALKGTDPEDAGLRPFARVLTDEYERTDVRTVPASLAGGGRLLYTTVVVHPPHLPDGVLQTLPVPVMAHPQRTTAVLLLSASTWSDRLRAAWRGAPA